VKGKNAKEKKGKKQRDGARQDRQTVAGHHPNIFINTRGGPKRAQRTRGKGTDATKILLPSSPVKTTQKTKETKERGRNRRKRKKGGAFQGAREKNKRAKT